MSTAAKEVPTGQRIGKPALVDVATFDELKNLGFRAEKLDDKGWTAFEINGDRTFGPAASLAALKTMVTLAIGNKIELPKDDGETNTEGETLEAADIDTEEVELTESPDGNTYLPGQGPKVNRQLSAAIINYHRIKLDRVAMTAKETAAKDEMKAIAQRFDDLYVPDPKKPGTKIYRVDNIISRRAMTSEEKFTTEEVDD